MRYFQSIVYQGLGESLDQMLSRVSSQFPPSAGADDIGVVLYNARSGAPQTIPVSLTTIYEYYAIRLAFPYLEGGMLG